MRIFSVLFVALFMLTSPAFAQESDSKPVVETTHAFTDHQPLLAVNRRTAIFPEEVGMIFHKMADKTPDFRQWANSSPRVKTAQVIDRNAIFIKEYNRMKSAYRSFEPGQVIPVHVDIDIAAYSDIQNLLVLDAFNERTYFSYNVYGSHYGIIPANIEQFHHMRLTPIEYRGIRELTGSVNTVKAEILLIPRLADSEKPMVLNDKDHWLIMADIAEIRFWGPKHSTLPTQGLGWFYRSPDYTPEENNELMDLFSN